MASGIGKSIGAVATGIGIASLAFSDMKGKQLDKACESIGLKAINMALQWMIKETSKGPIAISKGSKESHNPLSGDVAKKTLEQIGDGSAVKGAAKVLKEISNERS